MICWKFQFAAAYKNRGLVRLLPGQEAEAEKGFVERLAMNKELKTSIEQLISAVNWQLATKK